MIVIEIKGEKLVIPEIEDVPFLEEIKKKMIEDKKRTFKYLERAYLKFRNLEGQPLKKCERDFLSMISKDKNSIDNKIRYVCAFGTIRGALINELVTNKKGLLYYRSQKWL